MRDLFLALMFSVLLVGAALSAGCSITDTSREYYILDNNCGEVLLDIVKGDDSASSNTDAKPVLDVGIVPGL